MGLILENGYEVKTTFWLDFTIADAFGTNAIKDTYKRAFDEWKTNVEYVTELVIMLNWKCWEHYNKGNTEISKLYADFYYEAHNWCLDHLKGDDFQYYWKWTD